MNDKKYEEQEVQEIQEIIQPNPSDEAANIIGSMTPEQMDELFASLGEHPPSKHPTDTTNA